ncbi:MAG: SBBP repeat-containing protein, partial [Candidatus Thorarchaeota archaeon]
IDSLGNAYICGYTDSFAFPDTPNANDSIYNGGTFDAFVVRMNATGGMEYATFLGGSDYDYAYGIDFHPITKEMYVVGVTKSNNFPMQDAYDSSQDGDTDGFVVKYSADGSEFEYSTFLGGGMKDSALGVDVDSDGYCYVTGSTNSSDFPTSVGSWDALHGGGDYDAFITILDPDGQDLNQSAYLGGVDFDWGRAVTVGDDGRCYIVGYSGSANYPITSQIQSYHLENDAFLTVSTESHDTINMSTFLGTDSNDYASNVVIGSDDKIYIVGTTYGSDFIQVNPYNGTHGGGQDTYVMRINAELDTIEFSTFVGGSSSDDVTDVGVDSSGNIYIVGKTYSPDFPLVREIQDYGQAYLTKLAEDTTNPVITLNSPETGQKIHGGMHIDLDVTDDWFVDTVWYNWDNGDNFTVDTPFDVPCTLEDTYTLRVYANDSAGNEDSAVYTFLRGTTFFPSSTFLGGSTSEYGMAVTLDSAGNAYVFGHTASPNFPTLNALNDTHGGGYDLFLSKFSPAGELLYSTFIGGDDNDFAYRVAVDNSGDIYLAGYTQSDTGFPLVNAQNSTYGGWNYDSYLIKVDSSGSSIVFSTFLGGDRDDHIFGLALDTSGNVYVAGFTTSADFPTVNAYNDTKGAQSDGFLTKYDPTGQTMLYSTFLGGVSLDVIRDLAIDSDGYCYLTGQTGSSNFPTANAMNSTYNGGLDIFITKMKPGEPGLNYSTFYGGTGNEDTRSHAVDSSGNIYFTGISYAAGYPLKKEIQTYQGDKDIIITGINSTGTGVIFSTYLGSAGADEGHAIALNSAGQVYFAGFVSGSGVPMSNALDATYAGDYDVVVGRLTPTHDGIGFATLLGGTGREEVRGLDVYNDGSIVVVGNTMSNTFPTDDAFNDTYSGTRDVFVTWIGFDVSGPSIDDPPDFNVQVGSNGNTITWTPDDPNPDSYTVLVNGTVWDEGEWNPEDDNVTIGIDGLPEGVYNVTIIIYDEGGNGETSTVLITVLDDATVPTIDVPDDITYDEFSTGHWLTWTPGDDNPDTYTIYENGSVIDSGPWDGSAVAIQIDGLSYGSYNYTIVVEDIGNNTASDTVWIFIVDGTWPATDSPDDITMDEGSTSNQLIWSPTDAHPASYAIFRNGTELESGPWAGEVVAISLDGLSLGVYNYTMIVYDIDDNWGLDTVFVTVVDGTDPQLNSPSDIEYEFGDTGNEISWTAIDLHPVSYEIFVDGTSTMSEAWTDDTITVSADGFSVGVHDVEIVVTDIGGNTASDTVTVTVTTSATSPTTTTTPTIPPDGPDYTLIIIIVAAAGAIVVIIIIVMMKKKKS